MSDVCVEEAEILPLSAVGLIHALWKMVAWLLGHRSTNRATR